jgi:dUTP pyrophosphatase
MSKTIIPYTVTDEMQRIEDFGLNPALAKAHADDAAFDLRAAEECYLFPGERYTVKTGVRLALPVGFAGQVLPRSGLAAKHGITVLNAPGLIDPGYRGEIGVVLWNTGSILPGEPSVEPFRVSRGDRIAQLLIVRTADTKFVYYNRAAFSADLIGNDGRGEGGFGSTGR